MFRTGLLLALLLFGGAASVLGNSFGGDSHAKAKARQAANFPSKAIFLSTPVAAEPSGVIANCKAFVSVTSVTLGQSCAGTADSAAICQFPYVCDSANLCVAPDHSCSSNSDCDDGDSCIAGKCNFWFPVGYPCTPSANNCQTGNCDSATSLCVGGLAMGASCSSSAPYLAGRNPCDKGMYCSPSTGNCVTNPTNAGDQCFPPPALVSSEQVTPLTLCGYGQSCVRNVGSGNYVCLYDLQFVGDKCITNSGSGGDCGSGSYCSSSTGLCVKSPETSCTSYETCFASPNTYGYSICNCESGNCGWIQTTQPCASKIAAYRTCVKDNKCFNNGISYAYFFSFANANFCEVKCKSQIESMTCCLYDTAPSDIRSGIWYKKIFPTWAQTKCAAPPRLAKNPARLVFLALALLVAGFLA